MIRDATALNRQLAYFFKCAEAVETPEEIPPHPHTGFVHVSCVPVVGYDVVSVNQLFNAAVEAGDISAETIKSSCRLCIDRALYEVIRNSATFPKGKHLTAQALIFRLAILQCVNTLHIPAKAEQVVAARMGNIRRSGTGGPKSVSWPHHEYVRMLAGNEEYLFGTKDTDSNVEDGGFHYFCISVGKLDFQCVFENIGKSKVLGSAMSEMTRLAMLCAAWQRHSGGFPVTVPVIHPRLVMLGPQLLGKLSREVDERASAGKPLLEPNHLMVPLEGVKLVGNVNRAWGAFSVRSASNQVFSTGQSALMAHLLTWMDSQRMEDESKLGWPKLVEAQKDHHHQYYFEEEDDGLQHDAAAVEQVSPVD